MINALRLAQASNTPLRLQVRLAASAARLHALRWETLCDPVTGVSLATSQQVWISRTLASNEWTPVTPWPHQTLRALAVIAAPNNLADYQLAELTVVDEIARAQAALGIQTTTLAGAAATLDQIGTALREGYTILYFVGHSRTVEGETYLWLSDAVGKAVVTPGAALTRRVRELQRRPLLGTLIACDSAGSEDDNTLAALGPQLVTAGIPAVIAAQGYLSLETAARFIPALFTALRSRGQVERAVAEARAAIRERHDWWVPTLLTSLDDGWLW